MTTTLNGACLCGAARYHSDGPIKFAIRCYCTDCQKFSGTGSLPQIAVPREPFSHSGPIREFHQTSESGNALSFFFCGTCGASLFKSSALAPDIMFVCAGTVENPPTTVIDRDVFKSSRAEWDKS